MANHGLAAQFGDFTYTAFTTSITITGYTGTSSTVNIPGTITDLPVTIIGQSSFANKGSITSVIIPNSVTSIGIKAFQGSTKLASVTIPSSVTSIGDYAFQQCTGLTSISIPASVTTIGTGPFAACTKLPLIAVDALNPSYCSVDGALLNKIQTLIVQYPAGKTGGYVIPSTVSDIGSLAFQNSKLTSIAIGSGLTSIGSNTFIGCASLTSVVVPSSVTILSGTSFRGCSSLASITVDVGNPVYSSVNGVLFNKDQTILVTYPGGIAGTYEIPNTVNSIGQSAFSFCDKLTGITFPTSVTTIGEGSFSPCPSLTVLNLPSSITGIGSGAFSYCNGLTSVVIPANVSKLGVPVTPGNVSGLPNPAFTGCDNLMTITVEPSNPFYSSVNGVLFNKTQTELLNFPGGKAGSYVTPDGVTSIGNGAFSYDYKLTHVVIPKSVSNIGLGAFSACEALVSATFMGNAPTIDGGIFFRTASNFTVYYAVGSTGFTSPTWMDHPAFPASFSAWSSEYFLTETNPGIIGSTADPDHDGLPNAMEMALGGNPATGFDASLLPSVETTITDLGTGTADYFLFTYRRTDRSVAAGASSWGEYSSDLAGPWIQAVDETAGVKVVETPDFHGAGIDRVQVYIPRGTQAWMFGRMKVTVP